MWRWHERWLDNHLVIYLRDTRSFGLGVELSTYRFGLDIGWFGFWIEW